ncbi:MAG: hypothetical protein FWF29_01595 [Treponema sp.]|nr:hypothetical protein [Treponema sp.]
MENIFNSFIQNASVLQKGVFLLVAGILFVFIVQVIFYIVIKIWPKPKKTAE